MAERTGIAWTNATWNPVRGCERVSEGCRNCYAEVLAARHSYPAKDGKPAGWGHGLAEFVTRPGGIKEARWTGAIRTIETALDWPLRLRKPHRIFVNSMSDLFHKDVPEAFIDKVYAVMAMSPENTFQVLTKRPERMLAYLQRVEAEKDMQRWLNAARDMNAPGDCIGWLEREAEFPLPNVWQGVSVEDQGAADERIPLLLQTPAAVRWVSLEPLLGPIDLSALPIPPYALLPAYGTSHGFRMNALRRDDDKMFQPPAFLDWGVVGGESGSGFRPMDMHYARSIIRQFTEADVPVFVKQDNGPRPGMRGRFTEAEWALKEYPDAAAR